MILLNAILIGLKEIWAHKLRSLLTMLGIILGVSSLVTMAAIVKGMELGMIESMVAMGGLDKCRIVDEDLPDHQAHLEDQAPGKTMRDVRALVNGAPLLRLVSPELEVSYARVSRAGKSTRPSECVGVWPAVLEMNLFEVEHGRFFTALDEERASSVCVIGSGIRDELFGAPEDTGEPVIPIGEVVHINHQAFTIVGMFKHYESEQTRRAREAEQKAKNQGETKDAGPKRRKGYRSRHWDPYYRKNHIVYMPLNTAWVKFESAGDEEGIVSQRLDDIDIKVASMDVMTDALQQARNILMTTHKGIEDFEIRTQESEVNDINARIRNARISGGTVAALSLIVGGIGIMNIMLASINERVREIGTCKALGANSATVFAQIIVESVALATVGAIVGLAASYGLVGVVEILTDTGGGGRGYTRGSSAHPPEITSGAMLLAVVSSLVVGVAAGLLPAAKAAKLDPIEALRYE